MKRAAPKSVSSYLASLGSGQRAALKKLRAIIRASAPGAEDCISYQIPAVRYEGRVLVWFAAAASHCSFFPGARPIAVHKAALAPYKTSKGTIRFSPDKPLPATLVRKLVKTRIAEIRGRSH
jgi:uncharacterized protein YdhG (YjbR/CyaY superfamily)